MFRKLGLRYLQRACNMSRLTVAAFSTEQSVYLRYHNEKVFKSQ